MTPELKNITSKTSAPISVITFLYEGKAISLDPSEFSTHGDDVSEELSKTVYQYEVTAYWLSKMRKRKEDAINEKDALAAQLYNFLKIQGGYATKYHGIRPTEDSLKYAINEDKSYQQLTSNITVLSEICDQLWGLQKSVSMKFEVLKEIVSLIKLNRRQIDNLDRMNSDVQSPSYRG